MQKTVPERGVGRGHVPELCPHPASGRPQNSGEMEKQLLLSDAGVASYIPPAAKSSLDAGEQLRDAGRGNAGHPPLPPSSSASPPARILHCHPHPEPPQQDQRAAQTEGLMPTQPHSGCLCTGPAVPGCERRAEGDLGRGGVPLCWGLQPGSAAQPDLLSQAVQSHQPQRQRGVSFLLHHIRVFLKTSSGITVGSPLCHHLEALAVPSLTSSQSYCL